MRFLTIVGARPQFIKAAPFSLEIRKKNDEYLVHTGQHYDVNMSDLFFREMGIPKPDVQLGVGSGLHGQQTARMLEGIERELLRVRPDAVVIFGDTNSTLAGALAAAKLDLPIAHVEAGLRSFDRSMPEEINRIVADHLSTWLFAPSTRAVNQLGVEGITQGVFNVGDIMGDAIRLFSPLAEGESEVLNRLSLSPHNYALATIHRPSNTDHPERLRNILEGFRRCDVPVVFPIHPRTQAAIKQFGLDLDEVVEHSEPSGGAGRVILVEPVGYVEMIQLVSNAACVFTDSGGLQKEAYYLRVPCFTLRTQTEWPETIELGWNRLLDADPRQISEAPTTPRPAEVGDRYFPYGDGHTSAKIVKHLEGDWGSPRTLGNESEN